MTAGFHDVSLHMANFPPWSCGESGVHSIPNSENPGNFYHHSDTGCGGDDYRRRPIETDGLTISETSSHHVLSYLRNTQQESRFDEWFALLLLTLNLLRHPAVLTNLNTNFWGSLAVTKVHSHGLDAPYLAIEFNYLFCKKNKRTSSRSL